MCCPNKLFGTLTERHEKLNFAYRMIRSAKCIGILRFASRKTKKTSSEGQKNFLDRVHILGRRGWDLLLNHSQDMSEWILKILNHLIPRCSTCWSGWFRCRWRPWWLWWNRRRCSLYRWRQALTQGVWHNLKSCAETLLPRGDRCIPNWKPRQ